MPLAGVTRVGESANLVDSGSAGDRHQGADDIGRSLADQGLGCYWVLHRATTFVPGGGLFPLRSTVSARWVVESVHSRASTQAYQQGKAWPGAGWVSSVMR